MYIFICPIRAPARGALTGQSGPRRGWRQTNQKNGKKRGVFCSRHPEVFFVLAVFFGAAVKGLKKNWQGQNKKALPVFQNALGGVRVQVCFFCGSILLLLP